MERQQLELRERTADELVHRDVVHGGADQFVDARALRGRRCGEPEAERRGAALERLCPGSGFEVVHLVDDQEEEALADGIHSPVRALEREHGHRPERGDAVAETADETVVVGSKLDDPLFDESARRAQDGRGAAYLGRSGNGGARLARAGR